MKMTKQFMNHVDSATRASDIRVYYHCKETGSFIQNHSDGGDKQVVVNEWMKVNRQQSAIAEFLKQSTKLQSTMLQHSVGPESTSSISDKN